MKHLLVRRDRERKREKEREREREREREKKERKIERERERKRKRKMVGRDPQRPERVQKTAVLPVVANWSVPPGDFDVR